MKVIMARVAIFIGVMLIGTVFAWIGGYSFDYRSLGVGLYYFVVFAVASLLAANPYLDNYFD